MRWNFKARWLLGRSPRAKLLVLGFGPHNLAPMNDTKFTADDTAFPMTWRYYGLMSFAPSSDYTVAPIAALQAYGRFLLTPNLHLLLDMAYSSFGHPRDQHPFLWSGALLGDGSSMDEAQLRSVVARHFSPDREGAWVSTIQQQYLRQAVSEARSAGLDVLLVGTPTHPRYRRSIPPVLLRAYRDLCRDLDRLDRVRCLDMAELFDSDTLLFVDFDHVNGTGARRVTDICAPLLLEASVPVGAEPGSTNSDGST